MARIFISYRKDDAKQIAPRIHEWLMKRRRPGDVFIDTDGICGGQKWQKRIDEELGRTRVLLAVIAENWLDALKARDDPGVRRNQGPGDWVRFEIAAAIRRGVNILPVFVDDVKRLEPDDLPENLRDLLQNQGIRLRSDRFEEDMINISRALSELLESSGARPMADPPLTVVPKKGLESFEEKDRADFLKLQPRQLPNGLPENVDFWKTRIDCRDEEHPCRVGVLYGPCGCGKSSLIKAGVIAGLPDWILPVYVQATMTATETDLASKSVNALAKTLSPEEGGDLRKRFDRDDEGLDERLTRVLREPGVRDKKILLVLDQFEQWLAGRNAPGSLAQSRLRAVFKMCDGVNLQALIAVRSEFIDRMIPLGVEMSERNCYWLNGLGYEDARRVLEAFGRGYNKPWRDETAAFLDSAIDDMTRKKTACVLPVQLAMFAQTFENRLWTTKSLDDAGGAKAIPSLYFMHRFEDDRYKRHRKAAKAVLRELLPDGGDLKEPRSRAELLAVSGYHDRPDEFNQLLETLDRDLKLITPVSSQDGTPASGGESEAAAPASDYQLAHDYLLEPLRKWLDDPKKLTWAESSSRRLNEVTREWCSKGQRNRYLPSLGDWCLIEFFPRERMPEERALIVAARKYYGRRALASLLPIVLIAFLLHHQLRKVAAATAWNSFIQAKDQADAAAKLKTLSDYKERLRDEPMIVDTLGAAGEPVTPCARAAAALMHLGQFDKIRDYLSLKMTRKNPTPRTAIIDALANLHVDTGTLLDSLDQEKDPWVRRALVLALGECREADPLPDGPVRRKLEVLFKGDPDPGMHSAAGWALRTKDVMPAEGSAFDPSVDSRFYVARAEDLAKTKHHAFTMIQVRELKELKSPDTGDSRPAKVQKQWVSDREVTVGQFRTFVAELADLGLKDRFSFTFPDPDGKVEGTGFVTKDGRAKGDAGGAGSASPSEGSSATTGGDGRDDLLPIGGVDWYGALAFCTWLSEREGIEASKWYYRAGPEEAEKKEALKATLRSIANARESGELLKGKVPCEGYRLPWEEEWLVACKGGVEAPCFFGTGFAELWKKYVNADDSQAKPDNSATTMPRQKPCAVGKRKPNDLGFFDLLGNQGEWCLEAREKADAGTDPDSPMIMKAHAKLRGGSYVLPMEQINHKHELEVPASDVADNYGFRVARTTFHEDPRASDSKKKPHS